MTRRSTTPEQENEIVRLHSQGETFRAIAERLDVSKSAVQRTLDRARVPRGRPVQRQVHGAGKSVLDNTGTQQDQQTDKRKDRERDMRAMTFYLDPDLAEWLHVEAFRRRLSKSEFVRRILTEFRTR